jgi:hypothetical protein
MGIGATVETGAVAMATSASAVGVASGITGVARANPELGVVSAASGEPQAIARITRLPTPISNATLLRLRIDAVIAEIDIPTLRPLSTNNSLGMASSRSDYD